MDSQEQAEVEQAEQELARYFKRNGYLRLPSRKRREAEGSQAYKKGCEVRLVADDEAELVQIRLLLQRAGFRLASPYARSQYQWTQPVYGYQAVQRFCTFSGHKLDELATLQLALFDTQAPEEPAA